MPPADIAAYLAALDEPQRSTLTEMRRRVLAVVPEAEECISYGMPAFRVGGRVVAGLAAFKNHLAYLPHSGSVFGELTEELAGYTATKGSLHFAVDKPLPKTLVKQLITLRLKEKK
jgi:uncharacterized protein YdhG (YjbR/CyaY superfamily)